MIRSNINVPSFEPLEDRLLLSGTLLDDPGLTGDDVPVPALVASAEAGSDDEPEVAASGDAFLITSAAQSGEISRGDTYRVEWSGAADGSTVELWACGPGGWQLLGKNLAGDAGGFDWDTSEAREGWYYFSAWVMNADGSWSHDLSDNWLHVTPPANSAPTLTFNGIGGSVNLGEAYTVNWTVNDADGDAVNLSLWVYDSDNNWKMIASNLNGADGSYTWDTSADWVATGQYHFAAVLSDGRAWASSMSSDCICLVPGDATSDIVATVFNDNGQLVLDINGTEGADSIQIASISGGLRLTTADGHQDFLGAFDRVDVRGYGGDDVIRVTNDVAVDARLYGGEGNDRLYAAGAGSDLLDGGTGDDLLISVGGGSDQLYGQAGYDSFWGDTNDNVHDESSAETTDRTVHMIDSFYAAWTSDPNNQDYVSLEIAGQDLRDPSASGYYRDFSDHELFIGLPTIDDINQGSVGDCYYLASLGALTVSDPALVRQMITELGDGTYAVRFYNGSQEVYVRVDGELPTYSSSSWSLKYAKAGNDGQIWAPLMEKAYAHYRYGQNSYSSLNSGWMSTVNRHLLGTSSSNYYIPGYSSSTLWNMLSNALDAGHAVTLGTYSSTSGPIVANHAYVLESVSIVDGEMMVTLFNPWGYDGRSWDSNSSDGLLTVSMDIIKSNFNYAVVSLA